MNRPARFAIMLALQSAYMASSLAALAEEPRGRPGERRVEATRHEHRRFDPRHFDRRLWALGRAYPYGCRWGRCGYWWWAGGFWYFYDQPVYGPPGVVSEVAYDPQGNFVPVEAVVAVPPATMGPVAMPPPPPPPPQVAPNPVAGAIVGGALGGIVGGALGRGPGAVAGAAIGATTGAVVAAEAQPRPGGYYWWRGGCYYRYPNGAWSPPLGPNYCGY